MFWSKKKRPAAVPNTTPAFRPAAAPPAAPPPGPMEAVSGTVGFASGDRSWSETFNVVDSLEAVLRRQEYYFDRDGNTIRLAESGFVVAPVLVSFKPTDAGGSQTTTITRVTHPTLVPDGLFEFQHSAGKGLAESLDKGFSQWAQTDLVTLLDALDEKPSRCTRMEMGLPAADGRPERRRRVVLGPVSHLVEPAAGPPTADEAEHPFCPCCLLTKSFMAFEEQVKGEATFGIRLFAMRNADGSVAADCRVNGAEYEPGKAALRAYVGTWPDRGVEFRKQYVVIRSV